MIQRTLESIARSKKQGISFTDSYKLSPAYETLEKINSYQPQIRGKSDDELHSYTASFRQRLSDGETLDELLPEAYAVVKEAARRVYGAIREDSKKAEEIFGEGESAKFGEHFDEQIVGGIMLHKGYVSEMKTGEGKTLTAALPAYLNALTGEGVHVITANDYLAQRDAKWMSPLLKFLGMEVGTVHDEMKNPKDRKQAYKCDITYGTSWQFGFDYLKDNMAPTVEDRVQRGHNFALIDEVDSLLIDDARTPLIISGSVPSNTSLVSFADTIARCLVAKQDEIVESKKGSYEKTIKYFKSKDKLSKRQKKILDSLTSKLEALTEEHELSSNPEEDDNPNYHRKDNKKRTAWVEDVGFTWMEENAGDFGEYDTEDIELVGYVMEALKAHAIYEKNKDYIVENEQVLITDANTGRVMHGRRWGDGLHEAIEQKEGVQVQGSTTRQAMITLPFYFANYKRKAGMTGTAKTDTREFRQIYGMDTVEIPTHKPNQRTDLDDRLYVTEEDKLNAVVDRILCLNDEGRPVLVGTTDISKSRKLAEMLRQAGVTGFNVLNAEKENAEREAEIVAKAGQKYAITIATNMAGRGTDISLGEGVEELGGLAVIGTERHESRRIDNQLAGRTARQGDKGTSEFYLSLEDNLFNYVADMSKSVLKKIIGPTGIADKKVTNAIDYAQDAIRENQFAQRKSLLKYDANLNLQRNVVYTIRDELITGEDARDYLFSSLDDTIREVAKDIRVEAIDKRHAVLSGNDNYSPEFQEWHLKREKCKEFSPESITEFDVRDYMLEERMEEMFGVNVVRGKNWLHPSFGTSISDEEVELIREQIEGEYVMTAEEFGKGFEDVERNTLLAQMDYNWINHLTDLRGLRDSIWLKANAEKDLSTTYSIEAGEAFKEFMRTTFAQTMKSMIEVTRQMSQDSAYTKMINWAEEQNSKRAVPASD